MFHYKPYSPPKTFEQCKQTFMHIIIWKYWKVFMFLIGGKCQMFLALQAHRPAQNLWAVQTEKPWNIFIWKYRRIFMFLIGGKCQRCSSYYKRYGPPKTCEQCKQKSAFDRGVRISILLFRKIWAGYRSSRLFLLING
jgi:hypothetical protein